MEQWYESPEGRYLLDATLGGQLMFVWEAVYDDGKPVRQFDEFIFERALIDEGFVPPDHLRLSVDALDKEHVSQFRLLPIALTRKFAPWFQKPIEVFANPAAGEFFVSYWLTDHTFTKSGDRTVAEFKIRRHVVGIRKVNGESELRTLVVVSPSGQITVCMNDNQSYEGE